MNNKFWLLWNPAKDITVVFSEEPTYSDDNGWHLKGWLEGEGQGELFEVPKFSKIFPAHDLPPFEPVLKGLTLETEEHPALRKLLRG